MPRPAGYTAAMERRQREALIRKYSQGPRRLRAAFAKAPAAARTWRPGPGKWSALEVLGHCADSELNAAARARYLIGEAQPQIVGYDQDQWAVVFDYHQQRPAHCFALLDAVVDHTVAALRRAPASAWQKPGRHSEREGPYTLETWLGIYAQHMANHAGQIERNVKAWRAQARGRTRLARRR